jgi:hypothetical protein
MQVKTGITAAFNTASPQVFAGAAVKVGIGQLNIASLSGSGLDIVTQINVGTGVGIATAVAVSVHV